MVVAAHKVLLQVGLVESQSRDIDKDGTHQVEGWLGLLFTFVLGVEDIKLKKFASIGDLIQICLGQRDHHLVIAALPAGIAALIDNVGLEVTIVWLVHLLQLRWLGLDKCIWRLQIVDWVPQSHGGLDVDGQIELVNIHLLVLFHREH